MDRITADIVQLRQLCANAGRDFSEIAIAPQYIAIVDHNHDRAVARFASSQMHKHLVSLTQSTLKEQVGVSMVEANLIGTPAEIVEKALALEAAGVTHLLGLYFAVNTADELLDQMTLFSEEVAPRL